MNDDELINRLGGTTAVAEMCELTPSAVSQWRKSGIPKPWRRFLSLVRPDLFPVPAVHDGETEAGS